MLIVFLTSVAAHIQTMLEETQLKFEERYLVFHFHTIFLLIYWEHVKPHKLFSSEIEFSTETCIEVECKYGEVEN